MNPEIAKEAVNALTAKGYPTVGGECQRFVREVVERSGDTQAAAAMDRIRTGTAAGTLENFADTAYMVWHKPGAGNIPAAILVQAGDCLYKGEASTGGDPSGHTGIAFHNVIEADGESVLCVAENSTFHVHNPGDGAGYGSPANDARGWRTFTEWCKPHGMEGIVRL